MVPQKQPDSVGRSATLTIPELEQSKAPYTHCIEGRFTSLNARVLPMCRQVNQQPPNSHF